MSEYLGYRIKINDTTIPNGLIGRGSWVALPQKRIVDTWIDANLVEHEEVLETRKMEISFSIAPRYLSEHEQIADIFVDEEFLTVEYWDDKTCTYKTGLFKMDAPEFTHRNTEKNTILYEATPIHLVEY